METPDESLNYSRQLDAWSDALDKAAEANGNNPLINDPNDWIPDYPPQEEEDDNQDYEEYPEHPQDEQRDF